MTMDQKMKAPHPDDRLSAGGFLSLFPEGELIIGLAPMAGFTEAPFRAICAEEGASFTVTELVSARGIRYDRDLNRCGRYLTPTKGKKPWGIQLFGFDPGDFAFAIERLLSDPTYESASFIDLNTGCPAPKVVRDGAGAALMKTPNLVGRIVESSVKAAQLFDKLVTVKIRSGFDIEHINAPEIARVAEGAGASAVTVHARTRDQYYSGVADWSVIKRVRDAVAIPVLGNGDIVTAKDLQRMKLETNCDAFQVGRASRGNPFLFSMIRDIDTDEALLQLSPEEEILRKISCDDWLDVMTRHLDGMISLLGERTAVLEMRAHFAQYLRGFNGASIYRRQIMQPETRDEVISILHDAAIRREKARESLIGGGRQFL